MPKTITQIELIAVANELNELLDPDPRIKTAGSKINRLKKEIIEAGGLIESGDKLTRDTKDIIVFLGIELPEGVLVSEGKEEEIKEKVEDKSQKSELTFEELSAAALDMNKIMGLEPAINPEGQEVEDLKLAIINECYDADDVCEVYTTDEFSKETWATLKSLDITPFDPKKVVRTENKEKKAPASEKEKPAPKEKKPQVIASIIEIIENDGPISKEDILDKLVEIFPDRKRDSMEKTVRFQVPNKLIKSKGLNVVVSPALFSIEK